MNRERQVLKAAVAVWLAYGQGAVDAEHELQMYVDMDSYDIARATEDLVGTGHLRWYSEPGREESLKDGYSYSVVVPTAEGILEVLS